MCYRLIGKYSRAVQERVAEKLSARQERAGAENEGAAYAEFLARLCRWVARREQRRHKPLV